MARDRLMLLGADHQRLVRLGASLSHRLQQLTRRRLSPRLGPWASHQRAPRQARVGGVELGVGLARARARPG